MIDSHMAIYKKQLTPEQALQKLRHYCGYQERCHSEVKEKLYSLGVFKNEHDAIIATLIEEDYLNEERFAIAFAGGKFRVKQWGRVKIKYELKQKQVSEYSIKKGPATNKGRRIPGCIEKTGRRKICFVERRTTPGQEKENDRLFNPTGV